MRIIPRIVAAPSRRFRISPPPPSLDTEPPSAADSQLHRLPSPSPSPSSLLLPQHNREHDGPHQPQPELELDNGPPQSHSSLRRSLASRILPRDSLQDQNVMIGVIVGVLLLFFLIALLYFLHRYHGSIRFSRRKKSRHHHHHGHHGHGKYGSDSSKGSRTDSDMGHPPPPPPPV